jgi:hypothetical protein
VTTTRTLCRSIRVAALASALLLATAACSDDDAEPDVDGSTEQDGGRSEGADGAEDEDDGEVGGDDDPAGQTAMSIEVAPGTSDDFVGARADVEDVACEQQDGVWEARGTVTNPTSGPAAYRIYVSFLDAENQTRGLLQVDVDQVDSDATEEWSGELELGAGGLECHLRVERSGGDDEQAEDGGQRDQEGGDQESGEGGG